LKYFSTGNKSDVVGFKDALLQGLAPDGGLYMPKSIPNLGIEFFTSDFTYPELAVGMIHPFTKDVLSLNKLTEICESAFDFPLPLKKLNETDSTLELFHGPTFAFKDFAARFMARAMSHLIENDHCLTILVATSGDTGSAVANGFLGLNNIKVVILYPSNRVSAVQEKQLTTMGQNITSLEVNGSFDDCQRMVKQAFQDNELTESRAISSANSINIGRLLPQSVYYAWAWKKVNEPKIFSVPCGNFGNLTGGLLAKRMGLPVEKFIAATNANDVFPKYLGGGEVAAERAKQTISNAMDVSVPSNLERIKNLYNNEVDQIKSDIISWSFSDDETKRTIKELKEEDNYLTDPHSAVGILGLNKYREETGSTQKGVILSTAHPGKFANVVEPIIGEKMDLPKSLHRVLKKEKHAITIRNKYSYLKAFLMES
jgi:threonine synthase|tara:strand:- start:1550 stop:2833 length:1284 start_codon:yes stop_codon:yes gene_type:complete